MKKRWIVLMVFLGLAVFLAASPDCNAKDPIKVGIIRALTGAAADGGRSQVEALKFVYDQVNKEGGIGGRKIEYTIADSKTDPDTSKKLATRFIEVENVLFISGGTGSSECMAINKYAAMKKVPVFGHGHAMGLHKPPMGRWYFASEANAVETSKSILPILKQDGYNKIGMISVNHITGRTSLDLVKKFAPDFGLELVGSVPVDLGAAEATAEVSKVKATNPEAIWLFTFSRSTAAVAKALKALAWDVPIYALTLTAIPATKIIGTEPFEGWRFIAWSNNDAPEVVAVVKEYEKRYGKKPTEVGYFMGTYAATLVQIHVMKTMVEKGIPITRASLRDGMEKYSGGVQVPIPKPRVTKAYGDPPHMLIKAEDFIALEMKNGKLSTY
ncbi:ABC transporter substrate-binding protein [Thermodesulfobacteriota bacterium]